MGRNICQCICHCPSIDEKNGKLVCRCLPMQGKKYVNGFTVAVYRRGKLINGSVVVREEARGLC